ncbi:MAG: lipid IV(A) 3-deoxy-D-manno-octulosonic acid transferase [Ectothiorhodospiraceae bacterium]|jgi:3-deoxy-D-manno-octulosonic-acid transferase|nr:lipid IV(A) 3-deoxy-D-manno-octulosonic acid transferase [Ectothiorhodospiraceae bacterium]
MRALYTFLFHLALPAVLLRLWWKSRRNPAYRRRIGERFGRIPRLPARPRIWVHCVSVGETIAAAPLLRRLLERHPDHALLVTTTTPTGSDQLRRLFGETVEHCYLPLDLPFAVKGFLDRAAPRLAVVLETELWPNLYAALAARGIPLILINARLSERSFDGYRRYAPTLVRETLGGVRVLAAQGELDAARFRALGIDPARVVVTGNLKFDLDLPADLDEQGRALREELGDGRPVWVAASTHTGEEAEVLAAHRAVLTALPDALLVLVPRHPERAGEVERLTVEVGLPAARRSRGDAVTAGTAVYLVDTLGELMRFYAAADVCFVGGSLVPVGGHNLIEPAVLGRPVLSGPFLHNFTEIATRLREHAALVEVGDAPALADAVLSLLRDTAARAGLGEGARAVVSRNRGARQHTLELIDPLLGND